MSKFIEIKNLDNDVVSVNVDYIFQVEHGTHENNASGTTIKLATTGFNGFPYLCVETRLAYDCVMELIKS